MKKVFALLLVSLFLLGCSTKFEFGGKEVSISIGEKEEGETEPTGTAEEVEWEGEEAEPIGEEEGETVIIAGTSFEYGVSPVINSTQEGKNASWKLSITNTLLEDNNITASYANETKNFVLAPFDTERVEIKYLVPRIVSGFSFEKSLDLRIVSHTSGREENQKLFYTVLPVNNLVFISDFGRTGSGIKPEFSFSVSGSDYDSSVLFELALDIVDMQGAERLDFYFEPANRSKSVDEEELREGRNTLVITKDYVYEGLNSVKVLCPFGNITIKELNLNYAD